MMEMEEDDLLRTAIQGGQIDYSVWPALLPRIVSRIEEIARNEFPIPRLPAPAVIIPSSIPRPTTQTDSSEAAENFLSPLPSSPIDQTSSVSSQDTNKENTPVAPRMNQPISIPAPMPAPVLPPGVLPPQIASMLSEITSTLISTFPQYPPHTLQRLSELVLVPRQHYRTLPTYLHALDRVVHVTSGLNTYPLPPAIPDIKTASLLSNGVTDALAAPSPWATPGSDEALGGALLTPIPWLQPNHHGMGGPSPSALGTPGQRSPSSNSPNGGSGGGGSPRASSAAAAAGPMAASDLEGEVRTESTETIDGPNGVGSIETVSVSVNGIPSMGARGVGVTQGELLRQEQRAGVVPVSQLVPSHHVHGGNPHPQVHNRRSSASANQNQNQNQGGESTSPPSASSATLDGERAKSQSPPTAADLASAGVSTPSVGVGANIATGAGISSVGISTMGAGAGVGMGMGMGMVDADAPVGSVTGADEEKPHARGPEEIGAEDMGPQPGNGASAPSSASFEMHGIDVEAAVGRKAVASSGGRGSSRSPPTAEGVGVGVEGGDNMDIEVEVAGAGAENEGEGKREAEDELGVASKKLKEDPEAAAAATNVVSTAMDTSEDGKGVPEEGRQPQPEHVPGQGQEGGPDETAAV
ncbi:hypothetical protein GGR54DRAFT_69011 [Hypoxylon sp. NC1633]|nr:hypothetical protein GGR54DRAFT_69011 [Hypoxylon sp. NC1633]